MVVGEAPKHTLTDVSSSGLDCEPDGCSPPSPVRMVREPPHPGIYLCLFLLFLVLFKFWGRSVDAEIFMPLITAV